MGCIRIREANIREANIIEANIIDAQIREANSRRVDVDAANDAGFDVTAGVKEESPGVVDIDMGYIDGNVLNVTDLANMLKS